MLRDKSLIPLSRQHHHALALCVRIERAAEKSAFNLAAWQAEVEQQFEQEIRIHFLVEEEVLFPAAIRYPELAPVVKELFAEHEILRGFFAQACTRNLDSGSLQLFTSTLAGHIRKEERQLFEGIQKLLTPEEISALGNSLEARLAGLGATCSLPKPVPSP